MWARARISIDTTRTHRPAAETRWRQLNAFHGIPDITRKWEFAWFVRVLPGIIAPVLFVCISYPYLHKADGCVDKSSIELSEYTLLIVRSRHQKIQQGPIRFISTDRDRPSPAMDRRSTWYYSPRRRPLRVWSVEKRWRGDNENHIEPVFNQKRPVLDNAKPVAFVCLGNSFEGQFWRDMVFTLFYNNINILVKNIAFKLFHAYSDQKSHKCNQRLEMRHNSAICASASSHEGRTSKSIITPTDWIGLLGDNGNKIA